LSIDGPVYVCRQCNYLLHKSCAELPLKINHPFHPHPLVLIDTSSHFQCQACKCSVLGFRYSCNNCDFEMDVTCASLTNFPLKFQVHQHPLAYFNDNSSRFVTFTKKEKANSVTCSTCTNFTGFPFFRCVPCDFSIKLCCLSILPHTFKHSNHRHSLILTYSHIKDNSDDDDDSEYYCDVCEELRELRESTYYCKDCHYVAHTSCVFHEILPLLEGESGWRTCGEEIIKLQAKEYALIMKIEILTTMLNKLKENRELHVREYQIGLTEAETGNASTDQKTFASAVSDHPVITKLDEEIVILQADADALTKKLEKLTTKLHKLKGDIRNTLVATKLEVSLH
ncbi:uncharacterized protein LOC132272440, partial [Cornus florida]|uniref:uncharacterized protein LOC132272440 n=1 Tax=Cornus florida TaxID=4283 RepID=UPI0028A1CBCD